MLLGTVLKAFEHCQGGSGGLLHNRAQVILTAPDLSIELPSLNGIVFLGMEQGPLITAWVSPTPAN